MKYKREQHRMRFTKTYGIWCNMKSRCLNPKSINYKNYGGRGITVCERWLSFSNFFLDMGPAPDGLSIERKNNFGGYEPGNCKWATRVENANNKRNNVMVEYKGEIKPVSVWCRELGLNPRKVRQRLYSYKYTVDEAFREGNRNESVIEFNGKVQSVAAWCRELELNYKLTRQRLYRDKWTPERAFKK